MVDPANPTPNATGSPAAVAPAPDAGTPPASIGAAEQVSTDPVSREEHNKVVAERDHFKASKGDFSKVSQQLANANRTIDKHVATIETSTARISELEQAIIDVEEGPEGKAKTLTNMKKSLEAEKSKLKTEREELVKDRGEHAELLTEAKASTMAKLVTKVASELDVDPVEVEKMIDEFHLHSTDEANLTMYARYLPKLNSEGIPPEPGTPVSVFPPSLRGDPKGSGGIVLTREQETNEMFPNST